MGYIYKITHTPTGFYYIGKRCSFKDYDTYYGSGYAWKRFMKGKPIEEFKKEVLATSEDRDELSKLEKSFIGDLWKIDSFYFGGRCYNCSEGGEGWGQVIITEEKRKKLSIAAKRQWEKMTEEEKEHMSRRGKTHSEETKRKISKSMLGRPSPNKGKPSWNKGKKLSEEHKRNVSIAMKKWHKNKGSVA